ncbi:MAG TPA: hypothetical protein VMD04_03340 [Candidatus Margulisiibacteriota bacterium]|nr:hypothetical protein [Candidatus Margulisiibacteriota bacterium]
MKSVLAIIAISGFMVVGFPAATHLFAQDTRNEIMQLNREIRQKDDQIQALTYQVQTKQDEVDRIKRDLSDSQDEQNSLKRDLSDSQDELRTVKMKLSDYQAELDKVKAELASYRKVSGGVEGASRLPNAPVAATKKAAGGAKDYSGSEESNSDSQLSDIPGHQEEHWIGPPP